MATCDNAAASVGRPQAEAGGCGEDGGFCPSAWSDFFVTYTPPSQRSEEWMRGRVEQLKKDVSKMLLDAGEASDGVAETVSLVDALERLGIDHHFREEINAALRSVHGKEDLAGSADLHHVALRFRLLRQHGFWVSAEVFDKFRDGEGRFCSSLSDDPRGLLSLYNAAHLAIPGEAAQLDDAVVFARRHLEHSKLVLGSPMAEQVWRALDIPLPRTTKRLETTHYICEYGKEETHNAVILELAKLEFNILRCLHLKELNALSLWWRDLYNAVKLNYSRDRMVEIYFWTCAVFHEEEFARSRNIFAKVFGLTSLVDDTFDVHATLEECQKLNEAIQKWDESAVSILPDYLKVLYLKLMSNFRELEDSLKPNAKYRMTYFKKAYKLLSEYYLQEAKWANENYIPSFKEHMGVSVISSGLPMLAIAALVGMGDDVATQEVFDWTINVSDAVHACGEIARFLNDIASFKLGKNKKDVANSVECYMKEHKVTGEEAVAKISSLVEARWKVINGACFENPQLLPLIQLVASLTRTLELIYLRGRDAYTFCNDLNELVASFFLRPIPLSSSKD